MRLCVYVCSKRATKQHPLLSQARLRAHAHAHTATDQVVYECRDGWGARKATRVRCPLLPHTSHARARAHTHPYPVVDERQDEWGCQQSNTWYGVVQFCLICLTCCAVPHEQHATCACVGLAAIAGTLCCMHAASACTHPRADRPHCMACAAKQGPQMSPRGHTATDCGPTLVHEMA